MFPPHAKTDRSSPPLYIRHGTYVLFSCNQYLSFAISIPRASRMSIDPPPNLQLWKAGLRSLCDSIVTISAGNIGACVRLLVVARHGHEPGAQTTRAQHITR